jgi:hypothetical protein
MAAWGRLRSNSPLNANGSVGWKAGLSQSSEAVPEKRSVAIQMSDYPGGFRRGRPYTVRCRPRTRDMANRVLPKHSAEAVARRHAKHLCLPLLASSNYLAWQIRGYADARSSRSMTRR